jgi:hypothetical protein
VNDAEASEFYKDPRHLRIAGLGRKRKGPRLTSMTAVRFAPEVIEAVKAAAFREGVTVGSWIRRLVQRELAKPRAGAARPTGLIPGSGRMGRPRALPSSLSPCEPHTFICPHMGISGVQSASCGICGPLTAVA